MNRAGTSVASTGSATMKNAFSVHIYKENRKIPFGFAMNIGKLFINL